MTDPTEYLEFTETVFELDATASDGLHRYIRHLSSTYHITNAGQNPALVLEANPDGSLSIVSAVPIAGGDGPMAMHPVRVQIPASSRPKLAKWLEVPSHGTRTFSRPGPGNVKFTWTENDTINIIVNRTVDLAEDTMSAVADTVRTPLDTATGQDRYTARTLLDEAVRIAQTGPVWEPTLWRQLAETAAQVEHGERLDAQAEAWNRGPEPAPVEEADVPVTPLTVRPTYGPCNRDDQHRPHQEDQTVWCPGLHRDGVRPPFDCGSPDLHGPHVHTRFAVQELCIGGGILRAERIELGPQPDPITDPANGTDWVQILINHAYATVDDSVLDTMRQLLTDAGAPAWVTDQFHTQNGNDDDD